MSKGGAKTMKKKTMKKHKKSIVHRPFTMKVKSKESKFKKNIEHLLEKSNTNITENINILKRFEKFFGKMLKLADYISEINVNTDTEIEIILVIDKVSHHLKNIDKKLGGLKHYIKKYPDVYDKINLYNNNNNMNNNNNNSYNSLIKINTKMIELYNYYLSELDDLYKDVNLPSNVQSNISIIQLTLAGNLTNEFFPIQNTNEDDELTKMFKHLNVKKNLTEDLLDIFSKVSI